MMDPLFAAASSSAIAAPGAAAVVVSAPSTSSTTVLLALVALFLIYFGPSLARVVLKPERGSKLDLRIAWFETMVADFEKRTKVTEKLAALAKLPPVVTAALPPVPVPVPETERPTVPPLVPAPPSALTTDDVLTAEVPLPADTDRRGYDSVPPEKEEP